MTFDSNKFRQTMRLWATGVTVVAAKHGEVMHGMTVSSFSSVTLEPPLILVCIQKQVETAQVIIDSGSFAVSMLGEDHAYLSDLFAGYVPLADGQARFDGINLIFATTGSPILADAMGWLDCKVNATFDGNTHYIFIGQVVEASGQGEHIQSPLLYYNTEYHRLG